MRFHQKHETLLFLSLVLVVACFIRYLFYLGHIFSDDAYYNYLSYTLFNGNFAQDYLGYPHYPLRINIYFLTALAFKLFGANEFATTVFPMIYSLAAIIVAYFCADTFTNSKQIARLTALIMTFLPTEIVFASLNFSDAPSALFLNLGILLLYLAWKKNRLHYSILSGLSFALSIQFKMSILFVSILLMLLWLYDWYKYRHINYHIIIALSFVIFDFLIEAMIYHKMYGDFFYRLTLIEKNSLYGKHEFFTLGSALGYADKSQFWPELFKLIFIKNVKYFFLRRFYLFIPLIALIQSIIFFKKGKNRLLVFWFIGFAVLFIAFTSSLQRYQPMVLRLSWYLFPIFLPASILSAYFLNSTHQKVRYGAMVLYIAASLYMCCQYHNYFNMQDVRAFKNFLKKHQAESIYSDHYTQYSIDLIDRYHQPLRTNRICGSAFDLLSIPENSMIAYIPNHISELQKQGHQFPDFTLLSSSQFKLVFQAGQYRIYKRIRNSSSDSIVP
jgi:4-amino-4-deoxy-L-arabinose transferase-like glycosyltransferase